MVLAGSLQSSIPTLLTETNLARLPIEVARQLMDSLPKQTADRIPPPGGLTNEGSSSSTTSGQHAIPAVDTSSSSSNLAGKFIRLIPVNMVLVELLGTHDLYWVRSESLSTFDMAVQTLNQSPRQNEVNMQEAVQVVQWLEDEKSEIPLTATDVLSLGDVAVPTLEDLDVLLKFGPNHSSLLSKSVGGTAVAGGTPTAAGSSMEQQKQKQQQQHNKSMKGSVGSSTTQQQQQPSSSSSPGVTFVFDSALYENGGAGSSRRSRALIKTKAMLHWIDNFKSQHEVANAVGAISALSSSTPAASSSGNKYNKTTKSKSAKSSSSSSSSTTANPSPTEFGNSTGEGKSNETTTTTRRISESSSSDNTKLTSTAQGYRVMDGSNSAWQEGGDDHDSECMDNNETFTRKRHRQFTNDRYRDAYLEEEFDKLDHLEEEAYMEQHPQHPQHSQHSQHNQNHGQHSHQKKNASGQVVDARPYGVHRGGCTKYMFGVGLLTLREVNFQASIFSLESKSCKKRKLILKSELRRLQHVLNHLQAECKAQDQDQDEHAHVLKQPVAHDSHDPSTSMSDGADAGVGVDAGVDADVDAVNVSHST